MPTPRSQLISLEDTHWYHCVSRCVFRAWLCGFNKETGTDYEYNGNIDHSLPPVLKRLGLDGSDWLAFASKVEILFGNWVGSTSQINEVSDHIRRHWICSPVGSRRFFKPRHA